MLETWRCVAFADYLPKWFVNIYKPDGLSAEQSRQLSQDDLQRLANLMYGQRPRLSGQEVATILRESGAPHSWSDPGCCLDVGTVQLSGDPVLRRAGQAALADLRQYLVQTLDHFKAPLRLTEEQRSFLAKYSGDVSAGHAASAQRIEHFLKAVNDASSFLGRKRESPVWHINAIILHDKYIQVVGSGSHSKNGPTVRFIRKMLLRLDVVRKDEDDLKIDSFDSAIEQVLRRGGKVLATYGVVWP